MIASLFVFAWLGACEAAFAAETLGVLPLDVGAGVRLPVKVEALEEALAKGLSTSGRTVLPPSTFAGPDVIAAVTRVNPTYILRSRFQDAAAEGIRVTLTLYGAGGKKINAEEANCLAPDCSLGGLVRLLAKEVVRLGLSEPPAEVVEPAAPAPLPVDPPILAPTPVQAPAPEMRAPTWAWGALGAGGALVVSGSLLWWLDGNGTSCGTTSGACLREYDTKAAGITMLGLGGVGMLAGAASVLWLKQPTDRHEVSLHLLPSLSGIQLLGIY